MILDFNQKLCCAVSFCGHNIGLRTEFYRVLQCFEILSDENLLPEQQINFCLQVLVKRKIRLLFLSQNQKNELLKLIFAEYIAPEKPKKREKVIDYKFDSMHIFSSFMLAYGIDLTKSKLHWWKFMALLSGLPEDTKMSQILSIRQRPLPKPTKYNGEERAKLIRLKQEYRVHLTEKERKDELQTGLQKIALAMQAMSEDKKGGQ